MNIPLVNFKRQYQEIKEQIDASIQRVLDSGWYILGKECESLEKEFAEYCDASHAVGVNSGTDALVIALKALGVKEGDEVITVPNTAIPTVAAIHMVGAKTVFVDVNEADFLMDSTKIESAITEKTKAIIPVHLYGKACDMTSIVTIAKKHNVFVVEDCAQAHGAKHNGKKVGTFGDMGCFSFYPTKNLGAYGDAGMIVTNNEEVAKKVRMLRVYGQESKNKTIMHGFNSRLDEMQAAILRAKLILLEQNNAKRRAIAKRYCTEINNPLIILPDYCEDHVFHLFVIRCSRRKQLQEHLQKQGVKTAVHYPVPLHMQEAYKALGYDKGTFPVSEMLANEILTVPLFPEMTNNEIEHVIEKINTF